MNHKIHICHTKRKEVALKIHPYFQMFPLQITLQSAEFDVLFERDP